MFGPKGNPQARNLFDVIAKLQQAEDGGSKSADRTCDMKSVDPAYNRLHNAIRTARMCRVRKGSGMARLVFGMNQSLDGYVDHVAFAPSL